MGLGQHILMRAAIQVAVISLRSRDWLLVLFHTPPYLQALAGLAQQGVQPDTLAATTLLRACSKDMALAQNVFDELFGEYRCLEGRLQREWC